jgi:sugar phosphate isomerase/epimerase
MKYPILAERRGFIKKAGLLSGALALSAAPVWLSGCSKSGEKKEEAPEKALLTQAGLILYTVRDLIREKPVETLEKIAELGYQYLEFEAAGFNIPKEEIKSHMDRLGLVPIGGGGGIDRFLNQPDELIEENLYFGKKYAVCYWPWLGGGENPTLDAYKKIAEQFNQFGETCKKAGLQFVFHNHDFEFMELEGQIPYDLLLANTDPDLVKYELDVYWASKAGKNPMDYLNQHPGRFELLHFKDMEDSEEKRYMAVGKGVIDFKALYDKAKADGMQYYFVELDESEDPIASIAYGIDHLKKLGIA